MRLQIFPFSSGPNGCNVCYSINGGPIQQRHFPPGTTIKEIEAAIQGKPIPKPNPEAERKKREEEERNQRAAASQAPNTPTEDEIHEQDSEREKTVLTLNHMRQKLKEAHVKGYQLLKEDALKRKYNELVAQGIIKEDAEK
ncbi:MAG: hypothetical protein PUC15_08030 [Lentisphaeria bacterium]|nr:hypothetical protein [Lentisphaeria bacterium]